MRIKVDKIYKIENINLPFGKAYNLQADVTKDTKVCKTISITVSEDEYESINQNGYYDT